MKQGGDNFHAQLSWATAPAQLRLLTGPVYCWNHITSATISGNQWHSFRVWTISSWPMTSQTTTIVCSELAGYQLRGIPPQHWKVLLICPKSDVQPPSSLKAPLCPRCLHGLLKSSFSWTSTIVLFGSREMRVLFGYLLKWNTIFEENRAAAYFKLHVIILNWV